MGSKARLLVPLYQYPLAEKTWEPLYQAVSSHPNVDFVVVVNPNSGPFNGSGREPLPGHDYEREIPKLTVHGNVCTVGYIRIDYCKKPLPEVYEEIDTYGGWVNIPGLGLKGILLDETPNHYTAERAKYLDAVGTYIKKAKGFTGEKLVIHNPGTPPDSGLVIPGVDVIVTCEEPYERYKGSEVQKRLRDFHVDQPTSGYMISAVPDGEIKPLMNELKERGAYLFVTDLFDNFYESFGKSWSEFAAALDAA